MVSLYAVYTKGKAYLKFNYFPKVLRPIKVSSVFFHTVSRQPI